MASGDADAVTEELGDLLFAAVKVARFAGIDPEQAAHAACEKFIRRFAAMEAAAADSGVPLEQRTLAQMQPLWQRGQRRKEICTAVRDPCGILYHGICQHKHEVGGLPS